MDGSQFDVWTRRRFGLAASGLSASLLTLTGLDATAKKKHKKRKKKNKNKCINLGDTCATVQFPPSPCCDCLACGPTEVGGNNVCCRPGGAPCSAAAAGECCSGQCVNGFCFAKSSGASCSQGFQCLSLICANNQCA
jgi:hypothetical protein